MDDAPDTTRVHLRQLAEGGAASERTFARALERILEQQEDRDKIDAAREGAAKVWRWLGGIAATVAIGLGGGALSLAWQASADHGRVDRLERDVAEADARHEAHAEAARQRLEEIATRTTRIEVIVQRLDERTP